jgi:lipid-binding SYLF domain-containing protein
LVKAAGSAASCRLLPWPADRRDSGTVSLTIYKAGWVIGGSGSGGTLTFRGRSYALSADGLDYAFVFGGSKTVLRGRVSNPSAAAPARSC